MTFNFFQLNVPVLISDIIKSDIFDTIYNKMGVTERFVPRSAKFQVLSKGPNGNYYKFRIWDSGNMFVGIVREFGGYTKYREVVFLQGSNRTSLEFGYIQAPDSFVNDYVRGMVNAAPNIRIKYEEIYWGRRNNIGGSVNGDNMDDNNNDEHDDLSFNGEYADVVLKALKCDV